MDAATGAWHRGVPGRGRRNGRGVDHRHDKGGRPAAGARRFTASAGYAQVTWLATAALQLAIDTLLLIFGLQWLRKAVLRSSGSKALHDGRLFAFAVSLKGVFLEGVAAVFIVAHVRAQRPPDACRHRRGRSTAAVVVGCVVAVQPAGRRTRISMYLVPSERAHSTIQLNTLVNIR